jgi:hypothetical protein
MVIRSLKLMACRRERQRAALAGLQRTVDWAAIRDDQAWV